MNACIMFRNSEDQPSVIMNDQQCQEFYKKAIQLRGILRKVENAGNLYLGIRICDNGEEWSIFREIVSVIMGKDEKPIFFVDENRKLENWVLEILRSQINSKDIDIISFDMDEIMNYCPVTQESEVERYFAENYIG